MATNDTPVKLLLSSREAAAALSVCERTLWTLADEGQIPRVRIGKRVAYRVQDLEKWIATRIEKPGGHCDADTGQEVRYV